MCEPLTIIKIRWSESVWILCELVASGEKRRKRKLTFLGHSDRQDRRHFPHIIPINLILSTISRDRGGTHISAMVTLFSKILQKIGSNSPFATAGPQLTGSVENLGNYRLVRGRLKSPAAGLRESSMNVLATLVFSFIICYKSHIFILWHVMLFYVSILITF